MKILVVCQHFYPEEFKIVDICKELVKRGNEVTVLTGLPNYPKGKIFKEYRWCKKRREIEYGIKIIRVPLTGRGNNNFTIAFNYVTFAINSCIKAIFMKKNFDIVYAYQLSPISMVWPGIIVKKIKKIPLILQCMDLWPDSMIIGGIKKGTWQYKFFYDMSKKTYKNADKILVSSKEYISYFKSVLKLHNMKYEYFPNYSEEMFNNIKIMENEKFDLLFAGNIGPTQNVELIVEVAKELKEYKDIYFHVVGDGLCKKKCEELLYKYNLNNIKFYGRYPIDKMKKFYDEADAFLITMEDNEVVNKCEPGKLSSYMCAGKPIFGSINGAVKKIINDNDCGIIVSSNAVKDLSNAIKKNYKNKEALNKWSNNSKKYYNKHYSKEKNIQKLIKILDETIK